MVYRNDIPVEVGVASFGPKSCRPYTQTRFAGTERDGSYFWAFGCEALEPPTNGG